MQTAASLSGIDSALSIATTMLSGALVVAFLRRDLYRQYPVFFYYCAFDAIVSGFFLACTAFGVRQSLVMRSDLVFVISRWPIEFFVVMELIDRILSDHPGLAKIGRYFVLGSMAIALAGTLLTLGIDAKGHQSLGRILPMVFQADQGVSAFLFLFLALAGLFLWYFPVRLSLNTKAYYWGYSLFFLSKTGAVVLLILRGNPFHDMSSLIMMFSEMVIQIFWLSILKERGTQTSPVFHRSWTLEEQQRVLATLNSLERHITKPGAE